MSPSEMRDMVQCAADTAYTIFVAQDKNDAGIILIPEGLKMVLSDLVAAEEREQLLKKAIEEAQSWMWDCGPNNMNEIQVILRDALSSIYPKSNTEVADAPQVITSIVKDDSLDSSI